MADDNVSRSIVQAIIVLAHSLGVSVIAEGVEKPEILHLTSAMGCDFYQGYFLSRPMDAADATRFLETARPNNRNVQQSAERLSKPNAA